jgi:hypothetical protein
VTFLLRRLPAPAPVLFLLLLLLLLVPVRAGAQMESPGRRFGIFAGAAVGGAPLGQIAERNGTFAIPGLEYEVRALLRSAGGNEWSLGLLVDEYRLDQEVDRLTRSRFDYSSTGISMGYGRVEPQKGVPIHYGVELGWRRFEASSARPSVYTGEAEASRASGHAAILAVSYGIEVPLEVVRLVPRLRLETSYPDIGGGDGYSALHTARDLGVRASVGVGLKRMLRRSSAPARRDLPR